ncbi:MAG: DeoR/GlpR family DNA-binding transcription regulator [Bacteroidota bacterium]
MLKEERHQIILNEVRIHNRVLLTDIAELLKVSVDTVRRDIKELHSSKKLKKVHGGAISLGFDSYNFKEQRIYSLEEKSQIAEKAIALLKDGQVIVLSGGTTNLELAKLLPPRLKITCFTPSLPVAMQLMTKPNLEVIFIGGKLSNQAQITIGAAAIQNIAQVKFDLGFIGTGYLDPVDGLTEFDWDVVQIKRAIIAASKKTVLLSISEKLNSSQRYKTCDLNAIDALITELNPDNSLLVPFKKQNLQLL